MITKEQAAAEDAVEKLFAIKMDALERYQMDDETSKLLVMLLFANIPEGGDPRLDEQFLAKVIAGRMNSLGYSIDTKSKVLLMSISKSAGMAVMYCHYLAYLCKKNNMSGVTIDDICSKLFPCGFPSEDDMWDMWDGQKVEDWSNLLDHASASKSIMKTELEHA